MYGRKNNKAHEYAKEGNIDALIEYLDSNPNDINSLGNMVSIIVELLYDRSLSILI